MIVLCFLQLDRMESKLNEKVSKLHGCQERKLQLEENIQRLQPQLRDMKNTLEKYAKSMTVQPIHLFLFIHCVLFHLFGCICDLNNNQPMWLGVFLLSVLLPSVLPSFQSLADQETHLKPQIKELEANVLAAAPDKTKQKQMEKSLESFKKGKLWR